jgi:pimeloyl-ACP methyl ester carboxylesterase
LRLLEVRLDRVGGINDNGLPGRLVADQVGRAAEVVVHELPKEHFPTTLSSGLASFPEVSILRRALALLLLALAVGGIASAGADRPVVTTVYPVTHPKGLMVTSAGWPYCVQLRPLARNAGYSLLCGRFWKDGYTGYGLRRQRHLDWGNPAYLAAYAKAIHAVHARVGGELVLIGVSASGFAVATLAAHHPEIRPDRLIVIDSYLDLLARRRAAVNQTAKEIDEETGGSEAELKARSVHASGLATLARQGTELAFLWSVSAGERTEFNGATCNRDAYAVTLARLAQTLHRPVKAWVTRMTHAHDLWNHGQAIVAARYPGRMVVFRPDGGIPPGSTC